MFHKLNDVFLVYQKIELKNKNTKASITGVKIINCKFQNICISRSINDQYSHDAEIGTYLEQTGSLQNCSKPDTTL